MSFTVALVGGDGAGKTTIAHKLQRSSPLPIHYLYMGTSVGSSNVALPTSRLILRWKARAHRKELAAAGHDAPGAASTDPIPAHALEDQPLARGQLALWARCAHRVSEQWFRQLVAYYYQWRGHIVLCDRHFLFEYTPAAKERQAKTKMLSDRLFLWQLRHLYPQPDLTLFLDAPPAVLYARKAEWSLERLQRYRASILAQGAVTKNFVTVDATQPVDAVFDDVVAAIFTFAATKWGQKSATA